SRAQSIMAGTSDFPISRSPGDWLGRGIYFWQDAPTRAEVWAKFRCASSGEEPAVLSADISLERCVDFFDLKHFRELRKACPRFEKYEQGKGLSSSQAELRVAGGRVFTSDDPNPDPRTRKQILNNKDRALIDWYVESLRSSGYQVGSVRGIFLDGQAIFAESFLFDWSHVQVAVLERSVISNLRIVV